MSYEMLDFQKKNRVMFIKIISPIDNQRKLVRLADELIELYDEITWDEEVWAIILISAEGESFSTGTSWVKMISGEEVQQTRILSLAGTIAKLDRPVIAAINGDAIGLGLELALACDIRIAVEASHFGLPHIRAGVIPWDGGGQRLSRLVGRGKALEMILAGEIIDAKEAYRIGLVNKIVPSGELMTTAIGVAKEMASKGPIALMYAKEAIHKGMDMTLEQGLRLEADLYLLLHSTKDRAEGIQAFREKRTPRFEGK